LTVVRRRVVYLLLTAIVLLSIAVRYPLVEHERYQTDSYAMHYLAKSIVDNDQALWTFHPLSYVGLYPLSYPSGTPFLLAEIGDMTGVSIELSVLWMDFALATIFCLGAFVLARQFLKRSEHALMATFFTVLGARFIDTTYWDGSARGPMVVLIALLIFTALRGATVRDRRLLVVGFLFGVGCFATHHMAILLVLVGLAYLLASFQMSFVLRRFALRRRAAIVSVNVAAAIAIAFVSFSFFDYLGELVLGYSRNSLFEFEPDVLSALVNMGVSYTNQIGPILFLAAIGLYSALRYSRPSIETLVPVAVLIVFIPIYGNSLYVSMILSPFVAILGTATLFRWMAKPKRRKAMLAIAIALVATSVFIPLWSSDRWNSHEYIGDYTVEVDNGIFNDANYMRISYPYDYAISNSYVIAAQLSVSTDSRFLSSGFPMVVNGDVTKADIEENVAWSSRKFPVNLYNWFEYDNEPYVDGYVHGFVAYGVGYILATSGSSTGLFYQDHPRLVVVVDNDRSQYIGVYFEQDSRLTPELKDASWSSSGYPLSHDLDSYSIYTSEKTTVYIMSFGF
jgi:MFS family permease